MYDSLDSSEILFSASGSQLLSESPLLPSSSHTGLGGDDLSISELSLTDRTPVAPKAFSLLAPSARSSAQDNHVENDEERDTGENTEDTEANKRQAAKLREEKLRSDIFILRKLNASFALFNEALGDTRSANQRVAKQLEQTDALLNKYIAILSKSEDFARLIFDQKWEGAEADERELVRQQLEAREKAQREAEEKAALRQEEERRRQEEEERLEREERERVEQEQREKAATRGGVRGVRGTRASMRGHPAAQRRQLEAVR
ncbi:hypothetical protein H0H92_013059 [Tricholoma furcatifolium]|nr:hypothetical protein H0H92_013059 [Tricholoma furcatifolium]